MNGLKYLVLAATAAASLATMSAQAQTIARTSTLRAPVSTRTPATPVPPPTVVVSTCQRNGQGNASPC